MLNQILAATIVLATFVTGNAVQAQWTAEYNTTTNELIIESGYIQFDEFFNIYIDYPAPGQKALTWLVVEHNDGQSERFPLTLGSAQIERIIFYGDDDRDTVINDTNIEMWAFGGGDDDYLQGGSRADHLFGEDGDDVLIGKKGNDELVGGRGFDDLYGNQGNDMLAPGDDVNEGVLVGGYGNDTAELYNYTQNSYFDLGGQNGDTIEYLNR